MPKDILKIDRSKWKTGEDGSENSTGLGDTQLLNDEGFMCCLGFRCLQLGIPKKDILERGEPGDVDGWEVIPDLVNHHDWGTINTEFTNKAMKINDSGKLTRKQREYRIKQHFKKVNVDVVFTGEYTEPKQY